MSILFSGVVLFSTNCLIQVLIVAIPSIASNSRIPLKVPLSLKYQHILRESQFIMGIFRIKYHFCGALASFSGVTCFWHISLHRHVGQSRLLRAFCSLSLAGT